jgi:molybdenum cofactor cytidylyltransferase
VHERFGVVVLAAGAGKRMGGPKALMPVWDQPWWRIQRDRLSALNLIQTWAVNDRVEEAMYLNPDAPGRRVLVDSGEPMFASVAAGLRDLQEKSLQGVFVLPIDVPAPSPAVWDALTKSNRCSAPLFDNQKGHPVYLPTTWIESTAIPALNDADSRLDRLIGDSLELVEVSDPDVVCNLNTPEDLHHWLNA